MSTDSKEQGIKFTAKKQEKGSTSSRKLICLGAARQRSLALHRAGKNRAYEQHHQDVTRQRDNSSKVEGLLLLVVIITREHSIQNPRYSKDESGRNTAEQQQRLCPSVWFIYQHHSPCYSQLPMKQLFLNKANPNPPWSKEKKIMGLGAGPERSSSLCTWLHCCQQSI